MALSLVISRSAVRVQSLQGIGSDSSGVGIGSAPLSFRAFLCSIFSFLAWRFSLFFCSRWRLAMD